MRGGDNDIVDYDDDTALRGGGGDLVDSHDDTEMRGGDHVSVEETVTSVQC